MNEIIIEAKKYISFENDKAELEKILKDETTDKELSKMVETELNELKSQHVKIEKKLKLFYFLKMKLIKKMQLLKLEQAQAVLEASLFAADLLRCMKK